MSVAILSEEPIEEPIEEVLTETVLLLSEGKPDGQGSAVWLPASGRGEVYEADLNHRVHVSVLDQEDSNYPLVKEMFHELYPATHRLLSRVNIKVVATGGYSSRTYCIAKVTVLDVEDAGYRGSDPETLMEIAKDLGSCVFHNMNLRPITDSSYSYDRPDISDYTDEGFYYENLVAGTHRLVYDPEMAVARATATEKRVKKKRSNLGGRSVSWVTMHEMQDPLCSMRSTIERHIYLSRRYDYSERGGRYSLIHLWEQTVHTFNTVFGRNAHRQLKDFQKFMVLWRKHGPKTWTNFDACPGYGKSHKELFSWFDQESTVKFKKKKNHNFNNATDYRLKDSPGHREVSSD